MPLTLMFYQGWADTAGSDETFIMDEAIQFDDTKDGSDFWNHIFNTSFNVYKLSGNRISPFIDLTNVGVIAESNITWTATTPTNTTLGIDVSLDEITWTAATNGSPISLLPLGMNVVGKKLYLRERLTTTLNTATPSLTNVTITLTPGIQIINDGDMSISPEVWINKIGNGDVSIISLTNGGAETKFTGLANDETVYINFDTQDIVSDITGVYRYDNYNNVPIEIVPGINNFKVIGEANIQFRYQYKVLQG